MSKTIQGKHVPLVAILRAIADASADKGFGRDPWWRRGMLADVPNKVLFAKMAKRSITPLYDYGVSLNYPWLTDAGKAKLAELESAEPRK